MVLPISCASLDREMNKIPRPDPPHEARTAAEPEPELQPASRQAPPPVAAAATAVSLQASQEEPQPDPRLITRFASSGG